MCKIIAIANQKGGVGKTTTTSNLGIGLAKQGKKVLLIDADAQGSLTASLGFTEPDSLEVTLATIMGDLINDGEVEPGEGILHHEEGIDLMPGNIELSGLEVSLVNVMSRETVLRSYIEIVRESYDYILIDCMPSLGMITINAFACADSILIPVQARQKKKQSIVISIDREENRVFVSVFGKMVDNSIVNKAIRSVLARLEEKGKPIEDFTVHALRDTFATRYIEQGGSPQTLKTILGHSSLAMTMDLYSHVLPNTKQKEMDNLKIVL